MSDSESDYSQNGPTSIRPDSPSETSNYGRNRQDHDEEEDDDNSIILYEEEEEEDDIDAEDTHFKAICSNTNSEGIILCPRCGDFFCLPVTLSCGHTYCQDCLISYFDMFPKQRRCPRRGCNVRVDVSMNKLAPNCTMMLLLKMRGMLRQASATEDMIMQTYTNFSVDDRSVHDLDTLIRWLINQRSEISTQCKFNKFGVPPLHELEEGDYTRRLAVLESERMRLYAREYFGVGKNDGPKIDSYNLFLVDGLPWDDMDMQYPKKRKVQNLPFYGMAADNAVILLGVPNTHIQAGIEMLDVWGFPFQCMAIHLDIVEVEHIKKQAKNYTNAKVQYYLAGAIGNPACLRPLKQMKRVRVVTAKLSVEKPVEFYKQLQGMFRCDYRLELFAQTMRAGWHHALPDFIDTL